MTAARMLRALPWIVCASPSLALAQIPDMLTAFDAGGRALGAGSSFYANGIDTYSATFNPAGLGFNTRRGFDFTSRNLPKSNTTVTGSLSSMTLRTTAKSGELALGHVGAVFPLDQHGGNRGAMSISYSVGGWFNDTESGQNLAGGIETYFDFTRAKTNFVSVNYGRSVGDKSFSYGVGLIYAVQNVRNFQRITFTDNNIPPQITDNDSTGNGIGGIFGVLFTPTNRSNVSFGASVRTPIDIKGNGAALSLYNHIPGRVTLGTSIANDGLRGGRDSMVLGAQLDYFFDGQNSERLDRKASYAAFGGGMEYGYSWANGVVPIRLGFNFSPAGGDTFKSRSGFTYGIGYRPNKGDWTLDINFSRPTGGGMDTSLMFGYRFGG